MKKQTRPLSVSKRGLQNLSGTSPPATASAADAACYGACRWLSPDNTILSLLLRCVIVGVIYPGIWLGVTGRTAEWKQLWGILLRFLPKGKKAA